MCTIENVSKFDSDLVTLVVSMIEELKDQRRQSLVAKAIGVNKNVLIVDHDVMGDQANNVSVMINPRLVWSSPETVTDIEWDDRQPGRAFNVKRPKAIELEYQDIIGATCHTYFTLGLARTILREFDYVNGVTIVDEPATDSAAIG